MHVENPPFGRRTGRKLDYLTFKHPKKICMAVSRDVDVVERGTIRRRDGDPPECPSGPS